MLDDRKSAILRTVVETYIKTAQPVASSHVAETSELSVSPATVRNDMTMLEDEGYLSHPHTSAGRIPTEKGYRFFVDTLGPAQMHGPQASQVRAFFDHAHGEIEDMLASTSRLLSRVTSTTAVVVGELGESATVRSVHLVGLSSTVYLVVAVLSDGTIVKRTIESDSDVDEDLLAQASSVLAGALFGTHVGPLSAPPSVGDPRTDDVVANSVAALTSAFSESGQRVYVEGASHIANAFDATETLREVLVVLEQQLTVVSLVRDVLDRGLTVAIGSETGVATLAECSLVVAPYRVDNERAGTIGVLGPTRMNYQEVLAAVDAISNRLSGSLSEGQ